MPDPTARISAYAIQFQALDGNTESVYICSTETPNLTRDVLSEIPAPASANTCPSWSLGNSAAKAAFNAADFWVLPVMPGEGVRVTVLT